MSPDLPKARRYFEWVVSEIEQYLGAHILDVGSGYGIHLEYILPFYSNVTSIELSMECVNALRQKFRAYRNYEACQGDFEKASNLSWMISRGFDTILCLNVLEHLQDDIGALKRMHQILLQQRGVALLMVPAHTWLYGSMDKQAGHLRRYTVSALKQMLQLTGFEIIRLYHFNFLGVWPWFLNNRILKNDLNGSGVGWQIRVFDKYLVPIIKRLELGLKFPFGQSIIAIARVRND